jgi:hypothetical protein
MRWIVPILAITGLALNGCARWNLRGEGYDDESAHWAERLRRPTEEGQIYGFSTRAQEIERNLGVR